MTLWVPSSHSFSFFSSLFSLLSPIRLSPSSTLPTLRPFPMLCIFRSGLLGGWIRWWLVEGNFPGGHQPMLNCRCVAGESSRWAEVERSSPSRCCLRCLPRVGGASAPWGRSISHRRDRLLTHPAHRPFCRSQSYFYCNILHTCIVILRWF